jgi:uncharacterized protein
MIHRQMTEELLAAAGEYPVVTVLGPRQSGKTTLVRQAFPGKAYRSLEEPDLRAVAEHDPRGFLAAVPDGAILDEVQRVPDLLSYVQGIVDERQTPGQYVLTGSYLPGVRKAVSQTLAGRTAVLTLLPLTIGEIGCSDRRTPFDLVASGSFPRLHDRGLRAERFFNAYVQTFIERDVPALLQLKDMSRFQRFLTLLAGRLGQLVNYSSLANDVGVSSTTIKDWVGILTASFVVIELPPWFENVRKRVVKSPKLYFVDTGLAAFLLGLRTGDQVARDPSRGALFENLVVMEALKLRLNRGLRPELYFYRDARGNEVDLIVRDGRTLVPIEIKSTATFTPEFHRGLAALRRDLEATVHPGAVVYTGAQRLEYLGARVFNPLLHDDLAALVLPGD